MADDRKIAAGHNNAANLKRWSALSPPLFADFTAAINAQWTVAPRRRNGNLTMQIVGRPMVEYTFYLLTKAEYLYIYTTLCGSTYQGNVTIREFNTETQVYANYNGVLYLPENLTFWDNDIYNDVQIRVEHLAAI
jgi:hypothetical protein